MNDPATMDVVKGLKNLEHDANERPGFCALVRIQPPPVVLDHCLLRTGPESRESYVQTGG